MLKRIITTKTHLMQHHFSSGLSNGVNCGELNKQSALIAKQAIIDMDLKNHQIQDLFGFFRTNQ